LSNKVILPGQTIGIIGGGQLGRMMALAARAQGFRIAVLDPLEDSPCGQVADHQIVGDYNDLTAIKQLAELSDVITYEFENIDADALSWLCDNTYVPQGKDILEITQDRITEKAAIVASGLKVAPYALAITEQDIYDNIKKLGYPAVLKTSRGGYDGKGQVVLKTEADIGEAIRLLDHGPCVLEKWISFEKEISVIITRKANGEMATFPVAENIHVENILHQSIVPARIKPPTEEAALEVAAKLGGHLGLVGTLAVEMFVGVDGDIYINELAPRPHNSGHYTIEACVTSQFEQHIRAICNLPLGCTELLKPAVMVNILGEHQERLMKEIPVLTDCKVHLYGKKEAREKRKMGHITILSSTVEPVLAQIEASPIWNSVKEKIGGKTC
jgi:5-(carboxyamino)imidazole ribonucleotide synthase